MTEERFKAFLGEYGAVIDEAVALFAEYQRLRCKVTGKAPNSYLRFNAVDMETIEYEGDEYWSYGGHDHHSFALPTRWLWDENWRQEAVGEFKKEIKERTRSERESRLRKEESDRQLFEKLKEKFGR